MIEADPLLPGAGALAEAKAFLRVEGPGEDTLIGKVVGSAVELCEQFTGEVLLQRIFRERLRADGSWTKLGRRPVRAILGVEGIDGGSSVALLAGTYSTDIDADGAGWVRVIGPGTASQIRVTSSCGIAQDWGGIPEPLRQGIIRLAAHLYTHRSAAGDPGPPAAVTALWRPYRRLRLA